MTGLNTGRSNAAGPVEAYSLPSNAVLGSRETRLDAAHYNPEYFAAIELIGDSGMSVKRLDDIVSRVYLPNRFKRIYVSKDDGLPFLQGSHIVHFQPTDVKYLSPRSLPDINSIVINAGWLLVTRSGTVGRVTLCPTEWDGWAASEHIIRVIPDDAKCPSGYLCAFLGSPLGQIRLGASVHGAVVDELTDDQVRDVLVPLPDSPEDWQVVRSIDEKMKRAIEVKSNAVEAAVASSTEFADRFGIEG